MKRDIAGKAMSGFNALIQKTLGDKTAAATLDGAGNMQLGANLAKRINDAYNTLPGGWGTSEFSTATLKAFSTRNKAWLNTAAERLAKLSDDPHVDAGITGAETKFKFADQKKADAFADKLIAARTKAGLSKDTLSLSPPGVEVKLQNRDLLSLSQGQFDGLLAAAAGSDLANDRTAPDQTAPRSFRKDSLFRKP